MNDKHKNANSKMLPFTGERFVPEVHGNIELEHLHRYLQACQIATGKVVLDIASGEGYGSAMLASRASKAVGVDISAEAVKHARKRYNKENLEYMVGSCADIPLRDASVDLVVSFETIEHHDQHEKMMQEVRRVLRRTGVLLISSPDKYHYSVETGISNEYHIKELYLHEFKQLLGNYFKNVTYFGQRIIYGSGIFAESLPTHALSYWQENEVIRETPGIVKPVYWIALASNAELPKLAAGVLEQPIKDSEIIQSWGRAVAEHKDQIGKLTEDVRAYQQQAEEFDRQLRTHVRAYQQQAEEFDRQLRTAEEDKQRLGEALALANGQVGKLTEDVRAYQQQAEAFNGQLRKLVEQRTFELGSCRFLARHLMLALRRRIPNSMRTAYLLRTTRRLIFKLYSAGHHTVSLGKDVPSEKEPFDADFYLRLYPDIASAGVDPYEHFVNYGRNEGRIGTLPRLEYSGRIEGISPTRKTVLVVSHEASRTGAPILSLNIVRELKKKYNVITLLLGGGAIVDDFRHFSDIVVGPPTDKYNGSFVIDQLLALSHFSFAIVSSIESRAVLPGLARRFVPVVALIHEFSAYTRPKGALREAVFFSTETVFSTPLTLENAISEYSDLGNCQFHIIPQGRCALPAVKSDTASRMKEDAKVLSVLRPEGLPKDTVVVLGAGFVQLRKGVDLFIECAARVVQADHGEHCRFVWIGEGYEPGHDLVYSVYLADQIRRSGLQQYVFFMGETSSIEAAYRAADLLLISSRLDPLPNVAIDAMAHGLPVVCFEKTTGIADILSANGLGKECVAPYLDTVEMASRVIALARSKALRQKVGEQLRQLALKQFDMEGYVKQLEEVGLNASGRIAQERTNVEEISKSGLSRLDFFLPPHLKGELSDDAIWRYVRSWSSGIDRRKLFPGFHPGIFLEQYGMPESGGDPLVNYLRAGQPEGLWRYDMITSEEIAQPLAPETRIALHLHVYYPDLLSEMLTRLNRNRIRPDLFISVPTEFVRDEVRSELINYSGQVIEIQIVPNRGRDIGPFLTAFGAAFVDRYDVVGHLHTKKTTDVEGDMVGKNWYEFLLENLLGGKGNMADIILGRMAVDPSIGMVFADDPYVVGWGSNRSYAEALGQQVGLSTLPEYFLFPVGTMFWARVQALRPIFNLGLVWQDYPTEPLSYDGSLLHALERLLPFVVSNQGAHSVLTNVVGITR